MHISLTLNHICLYLRVWNLSNFQFFFVDAISEFINKHAKRYCTFFCHMPNYTRRRSWRRISSGIDSLFRCVMTRLSLPLKKPLSTKRRWPSPWTPWQVSCIEGLPPDEQILTFPEQVFNMDWLACVFELYMSEGNIYLKLVQDKTTRKQTCY